VFTEEQISLNTTEEAPQAISCGCPVVETTFENPPKNNKAKCCPAKMLPLLYCKKLSLDATIPHRATAEAAGFDMFAWVSKTT
jgi:hypothetical protein